MLHDWARRTKATTRLAVCTARLIMCTRRSSTTKGWSSDTLQSVNFIACKEVLLLTCGMTSNPAILCRRRHPSQHDHASCPSHRSRRGSPISSGGMSLRETCCSSRVPTICLFPGSTTTALGNSWPSTSVRLDSSLLSFPIGGGWGVKLFSMLRRHQEGQ